MKGTLSIAALVFCTGFFACNKPVQPLSKQEVSRKIDSAVKAGTAESDQAASIDLERRMKIEVKVKVDSILNARLLKQLIDTGSKSKPVVSK
jgi:hypothetical protein